MHMDHQCACWCLLCLRLIHHFLTRHIQTCRRYTAPSSNPSGKFCTYEATERKLESRADTAQCRRRTGTGYPNCPCTIAWSSKPSCCQGDNSIASKLWSLGQRGHISLKCVLLISFRSGPIFKQRLFHISTDWSKLQEHKKLQRTFLRPFQRFGEYVHSSWTFPQFHT